MKLIDIKDADGKESLIIPEMPPYILPKEVREEEMYWMDLKVDGYNQALEEQSQRQVAVEVDRDEILKAFNTKPNYEDELTDELFNQIKYLANHNDRDGLTKMMQISVHITRQECVEALIAHKEELFKIIYVKD